MHDCRRLVLLCNWAGHFSSSCLSLSLLGSVAEAQPHREKGRKKEREKRSGEIVVITRVVQMLALCLFISLVYF